MKSTVKYFFISDYDQQKPILLTTKLKNINSQNNIAPKSLLKKVKK